MQTIQEQCLFVVNHFECAFIEIWYKQNAFKVTLMIEPTFYVLGCSSFNITLHRAAPRAHACTLSKFDRDTCLLQNISLRQYSLHLWMWRPMRRNVTTNTKKSRRKCVSWNLSQFMTPWFFKWNAADCSHRHAWLRHQMEAFSALLAICAGNSPVPGEFPAQRPVTRSFDVFFLSASE